jgi:hypothetical protein
VGFLDHVTLHFPLFALNGVILFTFNTLRLVLVHGQGITVGFPIELRQDLAYGFRAIPRIGADRPWQLDVSSSSHSFRRALAESSMPNWLVLAARDADVPKPGQRGIGRALLCAVVSLHQGRGFEQALNNPVQCLRPTP